MTINACTETRRFVLPILVLWHVLGGIGQSICHSGIWLFCRIRPASLREVERNEHLTTSSSSSRRRTSDELSAGITCSSDPLLTPVGSLLNKRSVWRSSSSWMVVGLLHEFLQSRRSPGFTSSTWAVLYFSGSVTRNTFNLFGGEKPVRDLCGGGQHQKVCDLASWASSGEGRDDNDRVVMLRSDAMRESDAHWCGNCDRVDVLLYNHWRVFHCEYGTRRLQLCPHTKR